MAWDRQDDSMADWPHWDVLSGDSQARRDRLQASYWRCRQMAARTMSHGFLTEAGAVRACPDPKTRLALCTPVLDHPALVHARTDPECPHCTERYGPWIDGYAYRIHDFLRRNISRAARERHDNHLAALKDPRIKAAVRARWGGCCAYCRSGPLDVQAGRAIDRRKQLCYDRVNPDELIGADGQNLVLACERCNKDKGERTPAEADMPMFPMPSDEDKTAWSAQGRLLFDRPKTSIESIAESMGESTPDRWRIDGRSTNERRNQSTIEHRSPSTSDRRSPDDGDRGSVRPSPAESSAQGEAIERGRSTAWDGTGQAPDPAIQRDPYTGRSAPPAGRPAATPEPSTGPPTGVWLGSGKPVERGRGTASGPARECRWCGQPIPDARVGELCSQTCVNEFYGGA